MLRLQLVRREKRGLELREAALRAQGPAHMLLLEQLRWEWAQLQTGGANSSGGDSSGGRSSGDEEAWSQVSTLTRPGRDRSILLARWLWPSTAPSEPQFPLLHK